MTWKLERPMAIWRLWLYLEFLYFSLQLEHRLSSSSLTSASSDSDPESPSPTQLRRERRPAIYDAQVRTILKFLNVIETTVVKVLRKNKEGKRWATIRLELLYHLFFNVVKSRENLTQLWREKRQLFTAFYKDCVHYLS